MNLRELTIGEMVAVSAALLDPQENLLAMMQGDRLLSAFLPKLEQAHVDVVTVQEKVSSEEKQIKKLTDKMTSLDALHDRKARGVYQIVSGAMDLLDDPEEVEDHAELLKVLFPNGTSIINHNYRDQAGTARRVDSLLSAEMRAQLGAIQVGSVTALSGVEVWLDAGQRIGRHETARAQLKVKEKSDGVNAQAVREVRYAWIQCINALLGMLPLSSLDAEQQRTLLADLEEACEKARRKRAAEAAAEAEAAEAAAVDAEAAEAEAVDAEAVDAEPREAQAETPATPMANPEPSDA